MKRIICAINRTNERWPLSKGWMRGILAFVLWLCWGSAIALAQEPTPRATPTPAFLLEVAPDSGMPGAIVHIRGFGFQNTPRIDIRWDSRPLLLGLDVRVDGTFQAMVEIPQDTEGEHVISVTVADALEPLVSVIFRLYLPTATPTWTVTPTSTSTHTPYPTNTLPPTNTPPPTGTPTPTLSPTPRPTLRMATPIRLSPTPAPYTPPPVYVWPTPTRPPATPIVALTWTPTVVPTSATAATAEPVTATQPPSTTTQTPFAPETATSTPTWMPTSSPTAAPAAMPSPSPSPTLSVMANDSTLAETGAGPFAMVMAGGLLLGIGALGIRHIRITMPS